MEKLITKRFGYEWKKYSKLYNGYETQFKKWIYPLNKNFLKNKVILDAGCGMGRNSYFCALAGAKKIIAFDYDINTIYTAKRLLKNFKNVEVDYKNIYDINYKNKFDLIICIGVIHHLEFPEKAIKKLIKALKPKGTLLIWVYGYENNEWIVRFINPIRKLITSKLPLFILDKLTFLLSIPFYFHIKFIPQKHPYMKQLSKFKFKHLHSIIFDQLLPQIARYYKKEEAKALLKDLKDIRIYHCNRNSWTVLGRKL